MNRVKLFLTALICVFSFSCSDSDETDNVVLPESEIWHLESIPDTQIKYTGEDILHQVREYINEYRYYNPGGYGGLDKHATRGYGTEGYDYYYQFTDKEYLFTGNSSYKKGAYIKEGNKILFDDPTMVGMVSGDELIIVTDMRSRVAEDLKIDINKLIKVQIKERYKREKWVIPE